jgi:hypothetical protein
LEGGGMSESQTFLRVVSEAQMPSASPLASARHRTPSPRRPGIARDIVRLILVGCAAFTVVLIYIGVPIALLAGHRLNSLLHAILLAAAAVALGASTILCVLHSTNRDLDRDGTGPDAAEVDLYPAPRRAM